MTKKRKTPRPMAARPAIVRAALAYLYTGPGRDRDHAAHVLETRFNLDPKTARQIAAAYTPPKGI